MGIVVSTGMVNYDMIDHSKYIDSLNFARYSNPEVDALFEKGVATIDKAERKRICKELINIVQEDTVYTPVILPSDPRRL